MKLLSDTVFVRNLSRIAADIMINTHDPSTYEWICPMTESEEYVLSCLVEAGEIITACDQLHYSLAYLSGYRLRRTSAGEIITRADYIAYQMENLHLRFVMVLDRSLRLANTVFRLGLLARECNMRTVAENTYIRATSVKIYLKKLDKLVSPYRESRNIVAHSKRYSDPKLTQIEGYFIFEKHDEVYHDLNVGQFRQSFKQDADEYVLGVRKKHDPAVNGIVMAVADYFNALLPEVERRYNSLQ
jgi:hypothetical protein